MKIGKEGENPPVPAEVKRSGQRRGTYHTAEPGMGVQRDEFSEVGSELT